MKGEQMTYRELKLKEKRKRVAKAALPFLDLEILRNSESIQSIDAYIGKCADLNIEVRASTEQACLEHLNFAAEAKLQANYKFAEKILKANKQNYFFI